MRLLHVHVHIKVKHILISMLLSTAIPIYFTLQFYSVIFMPVCGIAYYCAFLVALGANWTRP